MESFRGKLVLYYNETIDECVLNVKKLLESLSEKHNTQDKIFAEVERVFQGVIFSAILFAACAAMCVVLSCFYCCRINFMDNSLKNDVDALTAKLKREKRYKKVPVTTPPLPNTEPAESCNIIVSNAGVYCV
ncbi:unnamed protein product [Leptidea sinapis]|uniref:Uncharacterized protein n=1 Tax=Leptidea sinapis TaxID=189913 RepID=A0A5E4QQS6_9NEOP|nr:unnamed protein product [Leptidea sinapis]